MKKKISVLIVLFIVILAALFVYPPNTLIFKLLKSYSLDKYNIIINCDKFELSPIDGLKITNFKLSNIHNELINEFEVLNLKWNLLKIYRNSKIQINSLDIKNIKSYVFSVNENKFNIDYLFENVVHPENSEPREKTTIALLNANIDKIEIKKVYNSILALNNIDIKNVVFDYSDSYTNSSDNLKVEMNIPLVREQKIDLDSNSKINFSGIYSLNNKKGTFDFDCYFELPLMSYKLKGYINDFKFKMLGIDKIELDSHYNNGTVKSKYNLTNFQIDKYLNLSGRGFFKYDIPENTDDIIKKLSIDSELLLEKVIFYNPEELRVLGNTFKIRTLEQPKLDFKNIDTHILIENGKLKIVDYLSMNRDGIDFKVNGWFTLNSRISDFTVGLSGDKLKNKIEVPFINYRTNIKPIIKKNINNFIKNEKDKLIDKLKNKIEDKLKDKKIEDKIKRLFGR